jgi:cytochrome c oxidase subunit 4
MSEHSEHHITPVKTYVKVAGALFILTFLTVIAHQLHLGAFAAPVAFLIATVKAGLVIVWFMHMKHDTLVNKIVFASGFFFLFLLFLFPVIDILTRVFEKNSL